MTEWNASDYNHISTLQRVLAEEHLALVKLTGNERVLDIGCGDGKVTAEIAARVPKGTVLGIDPSRRMIDFARGHFGPEKHGNLQFEVGDARALPCREEFDLVVSFNALHWVREQDRVLSCIRQALKPGGRAVLEFVPGGDPQAFEDVLEEIRTRPRWAKHFQAFANPFCHFLPDEYRKRATDAGLVVNRLLVEHGRWDFGSREAFAGFCHGTFVAWLEHVPEGEQAAYIADVLDRYRDRAADGPEEENTFKFFQMIVDLRKRGGATMAPTRRVP